MKNNPFLSNIFVSTWLKHFNDSKPAFTFKFIKEVAFVKNKHLPLYVNVGKNLTNGIGYTLDENETDFKSKVFFIYDIPEYFEVHNQLHGSLKLKTVRQYVGYLANLNTYKSIEDYLSDQFSTNSRWKIKKSKRRLEACFNIRYGVLYGQDTLKDDFDFAFGYFHKLLVKRFTEKQINNHYLSQKKWTYLQDVIYHMILENKAALFVIYNDNIPISVYLNYASPTILYSALPVFDPDYSKFNIGYIDNIKHIEWCIENKIDIFDFSKGDYDYKKRLGNKAYHFDYHILYDSKSILATVIAQFIFLYFKGKQYLRDLNINVLFHKAIYFIKGKKNTIIPLDYDSIEIDKLPPEDTLIKRDFSSISNEAMKKFLIDFLYKKSESINTISIFEVKNATHTYIVQTKDGIEKIRCHSK
ncbi:GNAT family N-acetyltransferase [Confluentibacter citreus]|uniref:GNAT family N-acetyltransferase n=1 Tax=Confluentibacter citreus TaxID=2007307 RepID=UPI000C28D719|nr:GNAT family N-acetyltransferase [Confluentibacter citreus]